MLAELPNPPRKGKLNGGGVTRKSRTMTKDNRIDFVIRPASRVSVFEPINV